MHSDEEPQLSFRWTERVPPVDVRVLGYDELIKEIITSTQALPIGKRNLMLFQGGPGSGKSTLLKQFCEEVSKIDINTTVFTYENAEREALRLQGLVPSRHERVEKPIQWQASYILERQIREEASQLYLDGREDIIVGEFPGIAEMSHESDWGASTTLFLVVNRCPSIEGIYIVRPVPDKEMILRASVERDANPTDPDLGYGGAGSNIVQATQRATKVIEDAGKALKGRWFVRQEKLMKAYEDPFNMEDFISEAKMGTEGIVDALSSYDCRVLSKVFLSFPPVRYGKPMPFPDVTQWP
jgi:hypothetical protein